MGALLDLALTATTDSPQPQGRVLCAVCAACRHFQARVGQSPDGWCRKYRVETWGEYRDGCADAFTAADPADRALEARQQEVEARLRTDQNLRIAADVADAPLRPEPGRPVSIVLAVRTAAGIVSAELHAPRERFDPALFIRYLKETSETPS